MCNGRCNVQHAKEGQCAAGAARLAWLPFRSVSGCLRALSNPLHSLGNTVAPHTTLYTSALPCTALALPNQRPHSSAQPSTALPRHALFAETQPPHCTVTALHCHNPAQHSAATHVMLRS